MRKIIIFVALLSSLCFGKIENLFAEDPPTTKKQKPALGSQIVAALDIAPIWSGHQVGFCLLTKAPFQFVAFYDADRRMTVASRKLDSNKWTLTRLPQKVVWDSHNFVTMALDDDGYLHLSGNMHCVPLVYFRSSKPFDATSLEPISAMVGKNEKQCTYPHFLRGPNNELLFTYRDGRSGSGDQIFNRYDLKTRTWSRLLDQPLTQGKGQANAYFHGPVRGPDGIFYLCWVWRSSPDCATNHHLSFARSKDLVHWERWDGTQMILPFTPALPITPKLSPVVDPVPVKGGLLNVNTRIGFDDQDRVVLSYHKFDAQGNTQLYNARLEDGHWKIYQTSDWNYRWDFHGGGTIIVEIGFGPVERQPDGSLIQSYRHVKHGSGTWLLDSKTLKPKGNYERKATRPSGLGKVESAFPGMKVHVTGDLGTSGEEGINYFLRWETLPPNRDRPYPEPWPSPSMLRVYKIRE